MILLRPTKMLAKRLSLTVAARPTAPSNPYADWSVHQFTFSRYRFLVAVNTRSLLPVVMPSRGITDGPTFVRTVLQNIESHLRDTGWGNLADKYLLPEMGAVALAPIESRSLLGSINEMVYFARVEMNAGLSPDEASVRMREIPMTYLEGGTSPDRIFPYMAGESATAVDRVRH
jgi:hypothetical protein